MRGTEDRPTGLAESKQIKSDMTCYPLDYVSQAICVQTHDCDTLSEDCR
jgi:hypothetical protein